MKKLGSFKDVATMTFGALLITLGVYFFLIPADIPLGSVSGLAIIINKVLPVRISVISFVLNVVLLVIGYIFIGPEFGVKTIYTALLSPVMMAVLEVIFPGNTSIMGDPILDIVCFLFVCSVGQAILFRINASSGGLDIVGKLLNKYLRMELGKAMSLGGMCAALTAVFCYDTRTVLLALLGTYLSGVVLDHFIFSFGGKKKICVITEKEEEVKRFILDTINRGATIYNAIGAYDGSPRREIVTLVDNNEYKKIIDFISRTDPKAFVSVYSVNEVLDNNKRPPKK